jgi:hypothetical protein
MYKALFSRDIASINAEIEFISGDLAKATNKNDKKKFNDQIKQLKKEQESYRKMTNDWNKSFKNQFAYYISLLEDLKDYDKQLVLEITMQVIEPYKDKDDILSKQMNTCFQIISKDIELTFSGNIKKVTRAPYENIIQKKS